MYSEHLLTYYLRNYFQIYLLNVQHWNCSLEYVIPPYLLELYN